MLALVCVAFLSLLLYTLSLFFSSRILRPRLSSLSVKSASVCQDHFASKLSWWLNITQNNAGRIACIRTRSRNLAALDFHTAVIAKPRANRLRLPPTTSILLNTCCEHDILPCHLYGFQRQMVVPGREGLIKTLEGRTDVVQWAGTLI